MSNTLNDFWSEILRCTAKGVSFDGIIACLDPLLAQTEISDFQVAILVQQHIVWLQVSVYDAISMKTSYGLNELGCIKTGSSFWKLCLLSQMEKQLATIKKIHDKVKLGISLEGVMKLYDKRTVDLF